MLMQLTAIIEREQDGYVALCPQVDATSQGSLRHSGRDCRWVNSGRYPEGMYADLAGHGFAEVRRRGSHVVMQRQIPGGSVTVLPVGRRSTCLKGLISVTRHSKIPPRPWVALSNWISRIALIAARTNLAMPRPWHNAAGTLA